MLAKPQRTKKKVSQSKNVTTRYFDPQHTWEEILPTYYENGQ